MNLHARQHATARRIGATVLLVGALVLAVAGCSASADQRSSSKDELAAASGPRYVALGDSFTSAPLVPVTEMAKGCFRSRSNYPALVARELGARLDDRSCGGARTIDFRRSQYPEVPPQLTAVKPGVELVTVSVGGNDQRVFTDLVSRCTRLRARDPDGSPCSAYMRSTGSDVLLSALRKTRSRVTAMVREVRERAPEAKVLVVGYPQIVSADSRCPELPLAEGDYAYGEQVNRALTEVLRFAAEETGSTYVDVWAASQGHDICSDDPWVNGAVTDQQRAAAYHPFAAEQVAVADLVVDAFRD
jgi:lysophospholipase L1-like esterase